MNTVLIIGGTGFIGEYITRQCQDKGLDVSVLSRNPEKYQDKSISRINYIAGDIYAMGVEQFRDLLKPFDGFVFAAGADERTAPIGDARDFYYQANVTPCRHLFDAARESGIKRAVLLSSIFNMVHRQSPELQLAEKHPYIYSRVEQNKICHQLSEDRYILTTLEVPWVFGKPIHGVSQWLPLVEYTRSAVPVMACRGGTNVIAVNSLAQAVVDSLLSVNASQTLPVGDMNISYHELLKLMCQFSHRNKAPFVSINDEILLELMKTGGMFKELFRIESGLDSQYLGDLLLRDITVDNSHSLSQLSYTTGCAKQAIKETVESIPENILQKNWRKTLNFFSSGKP